MSEAKQMGIELSLDEQTAPGTYANLVVISHSSSEFVLDFAALLPAMPKAKVQSRIIMTPEHAKRLMMSLQENITRYESNMGQIKFRQPEQHHNGFNKIGGAETEKRTVAVIGDSTFMHSGMTGLVNISYNASNSTVIILDNSITGMTGHQQNPTTGYNIHGDPAAKVDLEAFCRAVGIDRVTVVDPYDLAACEKAITEELASEGPGVIISRRPCVLLKTVKAKPALKVDPDSCRSCKKCMKLGCPAISFRDKKAVIDNTLCVGCGVCRQKCAFGAIV